MHLSSEDDTSLTHGRLNFLPLPKRKILAAYHYHCRPIAKLHYCSIQLKINSGMTEKCMKWRSESSADQPKLLIFKVVNE